MDGTHRSAEHTERPAVELIDEARRIAIGESNEDPSRDHLMALLEALDGQPPEPARAKWDGEGVSL